MNFIIKMFYSAAISQGKGRWFLTVFGLCFFILIFGVLVMVSLWTDKALALPPLASEMIYKPFSIVVGSAGVMLVAWSAAQFLKVRGTPVPFNPPGTLVSSGPYVYCRNPMLTGWFILLYGVAIGLRSVSMFFLYIPLFVLINYIELKKVEEPELEMRLGDEYIKYKKETPMFLIRPGKHKSR